MSGLFEEFDYSGDPYNEFPVYDSDVLITGSPNQPPVISDTPETSVSSVLSSVKGILGSIGTTARDIGTAVGTARRDISLAGQQYRTAQQQAYSGNSLGQWWNYSTTQDKLVIGLAVVGILVVLLRR